ncbi:MAG: HNH endonuclease [Paracoccaceae bacterium]
MVGEGDEEEVLSPLAAAHYLGITSELLFQYTKKRFAKSSGLRALNTIEKSGSTHFSKNELDAFNEILSGPWPTTDDRRPTIPKAILDHLRAESSNQCARCGSGIGVDTAHIVPWAESQSHHHANLIRLCSACHREHDAQNSLSTGELRALKEAIVERTRTNLMMRMQVTSPITGGPRPIANFVGRESERSILIDALRSGRSTMITGVGGIGKTELLVQALCAAETGRPVFWIDVELFRSPTDVLAALRIALGSGGVACPGENVATRLDTLQACVVFDGVERMAFDDVDTFEDAVIALISATSQTQFVVTSQVILHGLVVDTRLKIGRLDEVASQELLESFRPVEQVPERDDDTALLAFCGGHALTLRLAAALRDHYGGANQALTAINANGVAAISLPARKLQSPRTSLELCLQTAYNALSDDAQHLLWALSEAPAGVFTHYLEGDWLELGNPVEALAELRRWHLVEFARVHESMTRTQVLRPIRAFAIEAAQKNDSSSYDAVVDRLARAFQMIVAVLELKYDDPNETAYVISRYEDELPNFLHLLELARANRANTELGLVAISIVRAMMRYFFVRRLPEQGARVMHDAAELAISSGNAERASGLILQLIALASRAEDAELQQAGLALAGELEKQTDDIEVRADIAMCRAIAAREENDQLAAERHARAAFEAYSSQLRTAMAELDGNSGEQSEKKLALDEIHNDISHALGLLGSALLPQQRYEEARRAYRHSLNHERGASIGVNRGQTLHQIGNCECHLGRFNEAAKLYLEAAEIFHFVGMEEYLSNALGELGYVLLDIDDDFPLDALDVQIIDAAMSDLAKDIGRVFAPDRPIEHARAIGMVRKTFGFISLASISKHGRMLDDFCITLANERLLPLGRQIEQGERDQGERFPLAMMDIALRLGFYAAEAERALVEDGDITREIINEMLMTVCNAHDWVRNVVRIVDWLAILLSRRWRFTGVNPDRLHEFVQNYDDDTIDYLDLERRNDGSV